MGKLVKQLRYDKYGNSKINCYHINIPTKIIEEVKFDDNKDVEIRSEGNKIIIEQK